MDLDLFHRAVTGVRAEQFLREKAASAPAVDVFALVEQARLGDVLDGDLFKVAECMCPEDALGFYVKLGGKMKVAEPPPPKGVSSKAWDKILSKGPAGK